LPGKKQASGRRTLQTKNHPAFRRGETEKEAPQISLSLKKEIHGA